MIVYKLYHSLTLRKPQLPFWLFALWIFLLPSFQGQGQSLKYYYKLFQKGDSLKAWQKVEQASIDYPNEPLLTYWLFQRDYMGLLQKEEKLIASADSLYRILQKIQANYLALSPVERLEREEFGLHSERVDGLQSTFDSLVFTKVLNSKRSVVLLEQYLALPFGEQKAKAKATLSQLLFKALPKTDETALANFASTYGSYPEGKLALSIIDTLEFKKAIEIQQKKSYLLTKAESKPHFGELVAQAYWDSLYTSNASPLEWLAAIKNFKYVSYKWEQMLSSAVYGFLQNSSARDSLLFNFPQIPAKDRLRLISEPWFLLKDSASDNSWQLVNNLGLHRASFTFDTTNFPLEVKKGFYLGRLFPNGIAYFEGTNLLLSKYNGSLKTIDKNSFLSFAEEDFLKDFAFLKWYNTPLNSNVTGYTYSMLSPSLDTLHNYSFSKPLKGVRALSLELFLALYNDSSIQFFHKNGSMISEVFSFKWELFKDDNALILQFNLPVENGEADSIVEINTSFLTKAFALGSNRSVTDKLLSLSDLISLSKGINLDSSSSQSVAQSVSLNSKFSSASEFLAFHQLKMKTVVGQNKKKRFQLLSKDGKTIVSNISAFNLDAYGNLLLLRDDKFGLYNPTRSLLLEPVYSAIPKPYLYDNNGLYIIKMNDNYGLYSAKEGRLMVKPMYLNLLDWNRLNMIAETDSGFQFLSLMSFTVSNTVFKNSSVKSFSLDDGSKVELMVYRNKGKAGLISSQTGTLLEPLFEEIIIKQLPNKQLMFITSNELEGSKTMLSFYNGRGSLLFSRVYNSASLALE